MADDSNNLNFNIDLADNRGAQVVNPVEIIEEEKDNTVAAGEQ